VRRQTTQNPDFPAQVMPVGTRRLVDEVHVAVGTEDPYVRRNQGVFTCVGREWWLRNTGASPIELPGAMLLTGHERRLEPGHTPLVIRSSERRSHRIEVRVTDVGSRGVACQTNAPTKRPEVVYELDLRQRMVPTALAQRYLIQDAYPQPLAWQQVADSLNRPQQTASYGQRGPSRRKPPTCASS
jgi:hypothetical protein